MSNFPFDFAFTFSEPSFQLYSNRDEIKGKGNWEGGWWEMDGESDLKGGWRICRSQVGHLLHSDIQKHYSLDGFLSKHYYLKHDSYDAGSSSAPQLEIPDAYSWTYLIAVKQLQVKNNADPAGSLKSTFIGKLLHVLWAIQKVPYGDAGTTVTVATSVGSWYEGGRGWLRRWQQNDNESHDDDDGGNKSGIILPRATSRCASTKSGIRS